MFAYFRGWKRKTGLALLIVACVLMAGWIRSLWSFDTLITKWCSIQSFPGAILCERPGSPVNGQVTFVSQKAGGQRGGLLNPYQQISWKWRSCGFAYDELEEVTQNLTTGVVTIAVVRRYYCAYWPLACISAAVSSWLLLSPCRQTIPHNRDQMELANSASDPKIISTANPQP